MKTAASHNPSYEEMNSDAKEMNPNLTLHLILNVQIKVTIIELFEMKITVHRNDQVVFQSIYNQIISLIIFYLLISQVIGG